MESGLLRLAVHRLGDGLQQGGPTMTADDFMQVFGSLLVMYLVGWSSGFVIYTVRSFMEKI